MIQSTCPITNSPRERSQVSGEMNSIIATGTFTINRKGNGPQCYFQVCTCLRVA